MTEPSRGRPRTPVNEAIVKALHDGRWTVRNGDYAVWAERVRRMARQTGIPVDIEKTSRGLRFKAMFTEMEDSDYPAPALPHAAQVLPALPVGMATILSYCEPEDVRIPVSPPTNVTYTVQGIKDCDPLSWEDGYRHGYSACARDFRNYMEA